MTRRLELLTSTTVALSAAAALCGGATCAAAFVPSDPSVIRYSPKPAAAAFISPRRRSRHQTAGGSSFPSSSFDPQPNHVHILRAAKSDGDGAEGSGKDGKEEKKPSAKKSSSSSSERQPKKRTSTSASSSTGDSAKSNTSSVDLNNLELSKMEFSHAVKVAKAKAELDKLMNGPDPPFDTEAELAAVVGGLSAPLDSESPEATREAQVHAVETDLFAASDAGDFDQALALKTKLGKMHLDDCGSVLQMNAAFYRAFSEKDYDAMSDLWLRDSTVCCIHPSHEPLVGASDVLGSWKQMFGSGVKSFQHNKMEPTNVRLSVKGTTAVLTCDEEVYTRRFVRGRKRQTELVNRLTATNIFRKVGSKWHMVHHHSSWHADSDAARNALSAQMGGGTLSRSPRSRYSGRTSDDVPYMTAEDALGIPRNEGLTGKGYGGKSDASQKDGGGSGSSGLEGLGSLSEEVGLPGLSGLRRGGPVPGGDGSNGPVRRVFMGSLSDLLNGGLSSVLSDSLGASNDGGEEGTIIQFSHDDDEDDDDDDDDNDEPMVVRHIGTNDDGKKIKTVTVESSSSGGGGAPKDALRQNCITALRKLAKEGEISAKQKRVLLTDIITCSAKGEFSMVEVAYELLCGEGDATSRDAAEEDFADQCRVFASSLPEFSATKA